MWVAHKKPSRGCRTDAGMVCIPEPHWIPGARPAKGDPEMCAAASPAGSKTASTSKPELPRHPKLYPGGSREPREMAQ